MKKKITLRNDFHNTEVTILTSADSPREAWEEIQLGICAHDPGSIRKARRIEKALCGMSDCRCGTVRGPQD